MQSFLPKQLEIRGIINMPQQQEFYTVPWAIFADIEGLVWINGEYSYHTEKGGTVQTRIYRIGDIINVDINSLGDHKISRGSDWESGRKLPVRFLDSF